MVKLPPTPCDTMPSHASDQTPEIVYLPKDVIEPSSIVHLVEEAVNLKTNQLEYRYDFIDYFFEVPGGAIRARTYLHSTDNVSVYLPKGGTLEHPDTGRVLHYLARRFRKLERLGQDGYEEIPIEPGGMIDSRTGKPVP